MSLPLDISHIPAYFQARDSTSDLSVIEKCPVEVLTDIFLYCIEDHGREIEALLFVCKHWYMVITHTPLFWTNIFVSIREPSPSVAPRLRFVKAFIERSKESPLDIKVDCSHVRGLPVGEWQVYGPALDLLRDNMHRWRTLHVILPLNRALGGFICTLFKGSAPNLVKLSVQNFHFRSIQPVLYSELPNLRKLKIDVYPFKKMINSLPLASLLHSLDINLHGLDTWVAKYGYSNWTTDVSLLRSLRSLQIRYPEHGSHLMDSSPAPVSLPLLQELSIWNFSNPSLRLELPALQTLTFDGLHRPETRPIEVVWRPSYRIASNYLEGFFKGAIVHYQSAKRFVVPHWAQKELVSTLRGMKKEGVTLSSLVSFMKENERYERELVQHGVFDG